MVSMFRAWADITASALSVGENEPLDFLTLDRWQNPVIRAWFSQAAVLPQALHEIVTQQDFMGYPLDDVESWGKWVAEKFTPIWLQDVLFDKSGIPATPGSVLGEFCGLRTSPQTRWETLDQRLRSARAWTAVPDVTEDQVARIEAGDTVLSVLDQYQKAMMFNAFPEMVDLYDQAQADALTRASNTEKRLETGMQNIRDVAITDLGSAWDGVLGAEPGHDTKWLRDRYSDIMSAYGTGNDILQGMEEFAPIYAAWDEARKRREPEATLVDLAYWDYIESVAAPDFLTVDGDYDFEARRAALQQFRNMWGEDTYQKVLFVLENNKADFPDWTISLWKDRMALDDSGYWDLPSKPVYRMNERDQWLGKIPELYLPLWEEYGKLPDDARREQFLQEHPELARDWRAEYLVDHPEVDAMLLFWGYRSTPKSKQALDTVLQRCKDLGVSDRALTMSWQLPPAQHYDAYFEYQRLSDQYGSGSAQVRLFKLDNPDFLQFGKDAYGWQPVQEDRQLLDINVKWADLDTEYDSYGEALSDLYREDELARADARERLLRMNPEYNAARYTRQALQMDFPKSLTADYVEYYTTKWNTEHGGGTATWDSEYGESWWLMDHKDFYQTMLDMGVWTSKEDFSKVPSREVYKLYQKYLTIPKGFPRFNFRQLNPDLEQWLVWTQDYSPVGNRGMYDTSKPPTPEGQTADLPGGVMP